MNLNKLNACTFDLNIEDENLNHPRHLVRLGCHLLAYGGVSGKVTAFPLSYIAADDNTNNEDNIKGDIENNKRNSKYKYSTLLTFDDGVRALAISPDELRVAIGFEDGHTSIFAYHHYDLEECKAKSKENVHPLIFYDNMDSCCLINNMSMKQDKSNSLLKEGDIFDNGLLTQPSPLDEDIFHTSLSFETNKKGKCFPGPRLEAPVRSMQFDPRAGMNTLTNNVTENMIPYYLAVASESPPGMGIYDATNQNTIIDSKKRFLVDDVGSSHDMCGVRAVSYSTLPVVSSHHGKKFGEVFLATLDMNGRLCLWDVSSVDDPCLDWSLLHRDDRLVVSKRDVGEYLGSDVGDRSSFPVWSNVVLDHTNIQVLGVPGKRDLQLRCNVGNIGGFVDSKLSAVWPEKDLIISGKDGQSHNSEIVSIAFEPEGSYVVTGGRDHKICLWKIDDNQSVVPGKFLSEIGINDFLCTHILWLKIDGVDQYTKSLDVLCMALEDGSMIAIKGRKNIIPPSSKTRIFFDGTFPNKRFYENTKTTVKSMKIPDMTCSETLPGNNNEVCNYKINNISHIIHESQINNKFMSDSTQKSIDNIEDFEILEEEESSLVHSSGITLPGAQTAFSSSSTPSCHGQSKILCWNHIGVITLRFEETTNAVEITFVDSAFRRPVNFTDNIDFIVGSLGEDGAVFAGDLVEANDDDKLDEEVKNAVDELDIMSEATKAVIKKSQRRGTLNRDGIQKRYTGSTIYFHRFDTFGNLKDKDWHVVLTEGESVIGCACGVGWVAVITSRRFIRTFTNGGIQGPVIWLKGNPLTTVGRDSLLAVLYHESNPSIDGTQHIGYVLYNAITFSEVASGSVSAISSGSHITWAGFSDDYSLAVMDSQGMLSLLVTLNNDSKFNTTSRNWCWVPMLDSAELKKSSNDSFWPIHIQSGKLICVPLKGGVQYPNALRRPVTTSVKLNIPLAQGSTGIHIENMEEISLRANIALFHRKCINNIINNDNDIIEDTSGICAQVDKVTLRLFILVSEAGKVERAFDLIYRLHLEKSFDIAIKVADKLNLRKLSDCIYDIKENKFHSGKTGNEKVNDIETQRISKSVNPLTTSLKHTKDRPLLDNEQIENEEYKTIRNVRPKLSQKRDLLEEVQISQNECKRINPFAKKRIESPAKHALPKSPLKKPALSRMSSFSAQSRARSKTSKCFL